MCEPSRVSFLTGWPVHVRGHRSLYYALHPDEPNLFRYLKESGYDVYWYGKNDLLSPDSFASSVTHAEPGHRPTTRPRATSSHLRIRATTRSFTKEHPDRRKTRDYENVQSAAGSC